MEAIFQFSPGGCAKWCPCTRCSAGTAPRYWTANILGVDYVLWPARQDDTVQHCVWDTFPDEVTIGCGVATHILLNLGETISDYFFTLDVRKSDGTGLHNYSLTGLASVDCQTPRTLTKIGGTCGGSDTVTITPGPAAVACCACTDGSGSSSSPATPPDDGCCFVMPNAWDIDIPTPLWADLACLNCDLVTGVFNCTFYEWTPLGGARYRYTNSNWCADTAAPCVGGNAALFITVIFQGCALRVQIVLERLLLDHEICAASCRANYRSASWIDTKPIDCTIPAISCTQDNYPTGNSCSGRTYGTPGSPSFDTLCGDFRVGTPGPETITATAA